MQKIQKIESMINESPALCRFELCYLYLDERISMQIQYDNQFITRSFKKLYNKINFTEGVTKQDKSDK